MLGGIMRRRLRNTFVVQDERSETVHNPKAKLKTLYAMHIMQGETDAERGLLLREIIERLGDCGIQAECKDPRNDIQALRAFSCTDALHEAMRKRQKVEFMDYKYNVDGHRYATHDGKPHLVTPMGITYEDGNAPGQRRQDGDHPGPLRRGGGDLHEEQGCR